ncbi:uncharacterized protein LOC116340755 [Contarinia nasturtii]|uniref:uncharacterized protein LOC116340755 n=1 Tax=Contarinia nasturtii TaxID=265458 RepID=UPI0012D415B8|nr:uncharacterized protein LOC116340755 [Contarinia nasturtii]
MSAKHAKRRRLNTDNNELAELEVQQNSRQILPNSDEATTSKQHQNIETDEQKSSDEADNIESPLASCRLRHGLNEDCLYEIFKFLEVYDLIQLCELDIYFQNLISNWVIGRKKINFTKMDPCWTTNKIFQTFGKHMRKIKIAEENTLGSFERFLTFISQYCAVGGLSEVELRFSSPTASETTMQQSMPFFSNLRKLVLHDNYTLVTYKEFLSGIATSATNLTHLTLEGVNVSGEWLINGGMENLREFRLHTSKRRSMCIKVAELSQFIQTKEKLELFSFVGNENITLVIDSLTQSCPKLKTFVDFQLSNRYNHGTVTTIYSQSANQYGYVRKFTSVKTLGLTSYTQCGSDLYYPFVKLAAQNRIEALKIFVDRDSAIALPENNQMHYSKKDFNHFKSLKSIEIQIKSERNECDLNSEFILEFISNLANVTKLIVMSEPSIWDINKVVDMAPNLDELGISHLKMKYLPVEMRKLIKSVRKHRELRAQVQENPPRFHLIVNEHQWREMQVYKDVKNIIIFTIEKNNHGQSFKINGA